MMANAALDRDPPASAGFDLGAGFDRMSPAGVAAAVAEVLSPEEAAVAVPDWLRAHQVAPVRRAVHVLERRGGVMVALPIGAGKTYVALAAGAIIAPGRLIAVAAPAILADQWRRAAASVAIPIAFRSHEALSRGHGLDPSPVAIIDESHRLRDPSSRRYRTLAPDLVGRRTILVTGTPVVNRVADLTAQLLLAFRDDVLRLDGIPSLSAALVRAPPPEIGRLVLTGDPGDADAPSRSESAAIRWDGGNHWLDRVLRAIDRLRLSRHRGVASLIRGAFYRAAASSPAALLGSLKRYRRLLAHAADARRGGHPVNRAAIRAVIDRDPDQLVLWELLSAETAPIDLALGDLPRIERLEHRLGPGRAGQDAKRDRLVGLLRSGPATVVFTTAIETVGHLRDALPRREVAWLTGSRAGLGGLPATRAAVLAAFDPARPPPPGLVSPRVLLATDVAAEGLNLQRTGRVVHYDLPWTSVRLRQRDGRALRAGSVHRDVEVVRFAVPAAIETRLAIQQAVDRKALLGANVALAADIERALSVERRIARGAAGPAGSGWCPTAGDFSVAAFRLRDGRGGSAPLVLARQGSGPWRSDGELIEAAIAAVAAAAERPVAPDEPARAIADLTGPIGQRLAAANGAALFGNPISWRGLSVVTAACARCRRERRWDELRRWERALGLLGRGRSAGESLLIARILGGDAAGFDLLPSGKEESVGDVTATLIALAVHDRGATRRDAGGHRKPLVG